MASSNTPAAATRRTLPAAVTLLLALLSVAQGPRLCSASGNSHHKCVKVDFHRGNASTPHPGSLEPWSRHHDGMTMPFCNGTFWVSLNTTQLFKEVGRHCPDGDDKHALAPAPDARGTASFGPPGHGRKPVGCSSPRSTKWACDGYDVAVDQVKGLESAVEAMRKRACSKWVEVPTASPHGAGEKVLMCADCPAPAPPTKSKKKGARRELASRSGAFIIVIIIFLL